MINAERRVRAQIALDAYLAIPDTDTDKDSALIDLLTDLMHWAGHRPPGAVDEFDNALRMARFHYEAEV